MDYIYSPWNSPGRILEWVAFPFSKGSSQPRDQTQVSLSASGFFTSRATREAQEYWSGWSKYQSGWSIPSPVDLPDPGIKLGSPALQKQEQYVKSLQGANLPPLQCVHPFRCTPCTPGLALGSAAPSGD